MRIHLGNPPQDPGASPVGEGWHRIHSPGSRLGYLLAGLIGLVFPNLFCLWLIMVSVLQGGSGGGEATSTATPWGAVVIALLLFIPLHELLHAIFHPQQGMSAKTVMVIWPAKMRFGVYYEGCMTRSRWLAMRTAPLMVLSAIPAALLTLLLFVPGAFGLETFLQVMMLMNGVGSGGDLVAVFWVLSQVPPKAQICFCGGKAYWRSVSPQGSVVLPSA